MPANLKVQTVISSIHIFLTELITKPVYFSLPRLEYVVDAIGAANATMFSVLDLASGCWQIPIDPATRHKAASHVL
jgi:hypothetical protein